MKRSVLAYLLGIAIALLDGCRHSYHLQGQGPTAILIPPIPPATVKGPSPALRIKVAKARSRPAVLDGCDIDNDLIGLHWLGNTAEIRLQPDSYFPPPGSERPEEIAPRVYLNSLQRLKAFRDALEDRVIRGCLRSNEAQALTRAMVEEFPLPLAIAQFIRFGGGSIAGFVDLTPDFRLKVVSSVRASSTKEVVDYQIAYYRVTPAPDDARIKISLASISTGEPKADQEKEPASRAPLAFPDSFLFFRLFFRTAKSSTDHLATILSADDKATLNKATSRFAAEQNPSCEALSVPGATCTTPPPGVSVNLEIAVSVNRKPVFVPLGATLSRVMQWRKGGREIPPSLRIRRLFRGCLRAVKFDPATQDMLRFMLMPGDEITWKSGLP